MPSRLTRLGPLTGVLFAVLTLVALFSGGETPDTNASPLKVLSYYTVHRSKVETSAVLIAFAFLFAVFWAGALAGFLRRTGGADGLASLVVAGAVLMAVGAAVLASIEYGLAHEIHRVGPQTAQTLNILDNVLFLPLVIGACIFGLASGLAILGGADLPSWLGWVAIVLGIVAAIPPIGFIALGLLLLWTLVASILVFLRSAEGEPSRATPAAV
jgi:MFS family permease